MFWFLQIVESINYPLMMEKAVDHNNVKDPGAARQGNFINYYSFNPAENRVKHLPLDLLQSNLEPRSSDGSILCLDIGSNSGVSKITK